MVSQGRFLRLLRPAAVQADSRSTAEREVQGITAVAAARRQRQAAGQKQVQRGNVLTAEKARAAVDARVEADAPKVARKAACEYKATLQGVANDLACQHSTSE
jgi:hypothetical protein